MASVFRTLARFRTLRKHVAVRFIACAILGSFPRIRDG